MNVNIGQLRTAERVISLLAVVIGPLMIIPLFMVIIVTFCLELSLLCLKF